MLFSDFRDIYYSTSSQLNDPGPRKWGRYGGQNLFDGNPRTCWAEGVRGNGVGESLIFSVKKNTSHLLIRNGYQKNRALFLNNGRVKRIKAEILYGVNLEGHATELYTEFTTLAFPESRMIDLKDIYGNQKIGLPFDWKVLEKFAEDNERNFSENGKIFRKRFFLKLTIEAVYPGSRYEDTCVSDIRIISENGKEQD
jgi:hypothetical protein